MTTGPRSGRRRAAAADSTQAGDTSESGRSNRSVLEMVAVVLLGIATVATAWCGYQSSQWNDKETEEARAAGLARIESTRLFGLATQQVSYDANVTAQYAAAVSSDNEELATFIRENLVRPPYLPYLEEWEAKVQAGDTAPANLFSDEEYLEIMFAASNEAAAASDEALVRSAEANQNAADYLAMTLITATALFFAGVMSSFSSRPARIALVVISGAILAVALARIAGLPTV